MDPIDLKKLELDLAIRNREFELNQFWQRSNYFLALVAALSVGLFATDENFIRVLISLLALVVSSLWLSTNLGSRYWQNFWEQEVQCLSQELGVRSFTKSGSEIQIQMEANTNLDELSIDKRLFEQLMLRKPSVTINMIRLSSVFLIFWVCCLLYFLLFSGGGRELSITLNWS